jgi:hypothetical protein
MTKKENHVIYSTTSLVLAATLSLFYSVEGIDRSNPHKVEFQFKKTPKLESVLESYWRRELRVCPLEFFNNLKALKARIHGEE